MSFPFRDRKIIVLDDDPTGSQTVHGVSVYTDWEEDTIRAAFLEERKLFFLLTNSRSMSAEMTEKTHREIAGRIIRISEETGKDFFLISRSDSTLRGHYPLETETLRDVLEKNTAKHFDGEILIPFFPEGGRFTVGDIHYVRYGEKMIPAGETEFAKDVTFGYRSSDLKDYCEEKTRGKYPAKDVISISIEDLRSGEIQRILDKLEKVKDFGKIIVNSLNYEDLGMFAKALTKAVDHGKEFLIRGSAAIVKVLGEITEKPLLTPEELSISCEDKANGGLIVVGSHVKKSTDQLECLLNGLPGISSHCFEAASVFSEHRMAEEVVSLREAVQKDLREGKTSVLFTSREVLGASLPDKEEALKLSVKISEALTEIVHGLTVRPRYLIAKGGITSSDLGVKALMVRKAEVAGQIAPGIPVWQTGSESLFPGMPYIIFPGNVGDKDTLLQIVKRLNDESDAE